jgi:type III restriction enzyme
MLVIAPSIAEAEEIAGIVTDPSFAKGRYSDAVLTVHSDAPDEALAALDKLEDSDSPYRIVVSVGMLKEGWDVKNVYVIASLRASVSELLTEQTLGRGLRLPFGRYTGIEILDTLEVLGHERYEALLKKADVLNEKFIDWRTRAVLKRNAQGDLVPMIERQEVQAVVASVEGITSANASPGESAGVGGAVIESVEDHTVRAEEQVAALQVQLAPKPELSPLRIPQLKMTVVRNEFSLADITDRSPFKKLGESMAADPLGTLRRITLGAKIIQGPDGLRRTELVRTAAVDRVESPAILFALEDLREQLIEQVLSAPAVPARANQRRPAGEIVEAFIRGLGSSADKLLSGYMDRAAAGLIQVLLEEQRKYSNKPSYERVVELAEVTKTRIGRPETSADRYGPFRKGMGYEGYKNSLYTQDWFDSSTERDVANVLEDEPSIKMWVRLQIGDLPILWTEGGREYNPDFIAIDNDGTHWLIEVKMDKEMQTPDVKGKRDAARRWANYVSADEKVGGTRWRYLLVSESDVKTAKGSWVAMAALGE